VLRRGLFLLALLAFAVQAAEAPPPYEPRSVLLIVQDGGQAVRVSYHGTFPHKILSAIEDGLQMEITTEIVIRRKSRFILFRDEALVELAYSRDVQYSLIDGRYSINDSSTGGVLYFTSRDRFLHSLTAEIECRMGGAVKFVRGRSYYAAARVVMRSKGRLYPPFNFLPILSHGSPWIRSEEYKP